jgi:hypothetical protein
MIIHNLDFVGVSVAPFEAYTPLIVDADAMYAGPVAREAFKPIPWRRTKIRDLIGGVLRGAGPSPKPKNARNHAGPASHAGDG